MKLLHCSQCGKKLITKTENERERLFCQNCQEFIYKNPIPVVAGVILEQGNRILLIKRGMEPCINKWALPSGFIEINESPKECIIREIKEETNLNCRIKYLFGVYQQKGWRYESVIVLAYLLDIITGEAKAGDDAIDVCYFDYKKLPDIPFKSHKEIINDIFQTPS